MLTVACVLRSGGIYEPWHVYALQDGVASFLPEPHRFVCLTDMDVPGVDTVPLHHDWPGWWSKVELFRLEAERVLFFDLDTAIVGDLSDLASYDGDFAMMGDFSDPSLAASAVMAWRPSEPLRRDVYETFARMAEGAMAARPIAGDQHWIAGSVNDQWDDLRTLYPGQVVPWEAVKPNAVGDARVVCWYGSTKPWNTGWMEAA